jgi:hypothetical protein
MTRLQFEKTADACHRAPPPLRLFIENVLKTRKVVSLENLHVVLTNRAAKITKCPKAYSMKRRMLNPFEMGRLAKLPTAP